MYQPILLPGIGHGACEVTLLQFATVPAYPSDTKFGKLTSLIP